MRLSGSPNCCGVRYITELYDDDGFRDWRADTVKEHFAKLKRSCKQQKIYMAYFAGNQIDNNLYKACVKFGFQEYPRFLNTTGNEISVMYWIHPKARIKPKKEKK